eukprot:15337894-Alexandrium_andersonii.AAC.1
MFLPTVPANGRLPMVSASSSCQWFQPRSLLSVRSRVLQDIPAGSLPWFLPGSCPRTPVGSKFPLRSTYEQESALPHSLGTDG